MSSVLSMDYTDGLYTVEWERDDEIVTSIIETRTSIVGDPKGIHELDVEAWEYDACSHKTLHPPRDVFEAVACAERARQLELHRPQRDRGL